MRASILAGVQRSLARHRELQDGVDHAERLDATLAHRRPCDLEDLLPCSACLRLPFDHRNRHLPLARAEPLVGVIWVSFDRELWGVGILHRSGIEDLCHHVGQRDALRLGVGGVGAFCFAY